MTAKPPASRGKNRRGDILKAALSLFNERGSAAVSTNHIATELGISVGNLYWHFRDKEAIIRALWEEHRASFDAEWSPPGTEADAFAAAVASLRRTFTSAWEFRFIYRELVALTQADPELKRLTAANRVRRRGEIRAFTGALVDRGILAVSDDATLDRLEELAWMISSFWVPHVDLRDGTLTRRAVLEGTGALLAIYLPYVTKKYAAALARVVIAEKEET